MTIKENIPIFILFHIIPSIILILLNKKNLQGINKTSQIILGITIYGLTIGVITSFLFNKAIIDLYYITNNFSKQNHINISNIEIWIISIPGIFCLGNIIINIINNIIINKIIEYNKENNIQKIKFIELKIPDIFLLILTLSCIGSMLSTELLKIISTTSLIILSLPYVIFSFTTINLISKKIIKNKYFIFIIYSLIILLIWPIFIMVIIGVFEPWIRIRDWINKQK